MKVLSNKRCLIGEGPIWNEFDNKLYHVNGYGANEICCINLETKKNTVRKLPFGVSAMGFSKKGEMLISCKNGEVKVLLDSPILSNGFDWSMDEKRFYHTDSDTGIIKEYNFDKENGEISFTGRQVEVSGVDGFTIDQNDFLYVACWGRGYIAVVDTVDMQINEYIDVPAKIPASCG